MQQKIQPPPKEAAPHVEQREVIEERKRPGSAKREGATASKDIVPRAPSVPPPKHLLAESRS